MLLDACSCSHEMSLVRDLMNVLFENGEDILLYFIFMGVQCSELLGCWYLFYFID